MLATITFLLISNVFMTFAWYGHLKNLISKPLWMAIIISWSIALFEYCFQVPANRIGSQYFSLAQLKVIQEIITMVVFGVFAILYMRVELTRNFIYAGCCLVAAAFFYFSRFTLGGSSFIE